MSNLSDLSAIDSCFGVSGLTYVNGDVCELLPGKIEKIEPDISERAREVPNTDKYSKRANEILNNSNVENINKAAQQYHILGDKLNKRIVKYDDSKADGEYFTLDLETWNEIESHVIDENRIGVGRNNGLKDSRIFIQIGKQGITKTCDKYLMFCRRDWIELRKARGDDKYQPMQISKNGTVWVGESYIPCKLRVFIKSGGENES